MAECYGVPSIYEDGKGHRERDDTAERRRERKGSYEKIRVYAVKERKRDRERDKEEHREKEREKDVVYRLLRGCVGFLAKGA